MAKRLAVFRGALGVLVLVVCLVGFSGTASADSVTHNVTLNDGRNDFSSSKPGTLTRVMYGPYTIPASSGGTLGEIHNAIHFSAPTPCTNCRITDIVPDLVYSSDGVNPSASANLATATPGPMLHHFVFMNPNDPDTVCPSSLQGQLGNRFFAAGNERTHLHLPSNYGYTNTASAWRMVYHLVNRSTTARQVYISVTYRWQSGTTSTRPATPAWLDIDGCGPSGDSEYTLPASPVYTDAHSTWNSTLEGYVIGIAGHMHDVDVTNDVAADRCTVHCGATSGEARAVTAEIVGGPSSDYFGPIPPNFPPPSDVSGATLCRSEPSHGTAYGNARGYDGHLDTMSSCGVWDGPTNRQAEAYPDGAGYGSPGFFLRQGNQIKVHSEYDNKTGDPIDDAMGIMMMWVGGASYARPQGAAALRVPLTLAYRECGDNETPNRSHGPALSFPSCNPAVQASNFATIGTTDANTKAPQSVGSVKINVCPNGTSASGLCATPAGMTAPDVRLETNVTDVRNKTGLADYTGQLRTTFELRITDKYNGASQSEDGTTSDNPFGFTVPCAATGGTADLGSTCSVVTRFNAVIPGGILAAKRANWELNQIQVYDGGTDGQAATTADNTLFETQGIFVP